MDVVDEQTVRQALEGPDVVEQAVTAMVRFVPSEVTGTLEGWRYYLDILRPSDTLVEPCGVFRGAKRYPTKETAAKAGREAATLFGIEVVE